MVFCRRATGSPTAASLNPMMNFSATGRVSKTASGRSTDSWWPSRQSVLTASKISMHLSMYVSPSSTCLARYLLLMPFSFRLFQKLCTNSVIWKRLKHPNVVSFLGFDSDSPPFSLVYPWMSNGNLSDYLRNHPNVDRLSLVCGYLRQGRQLSGDPDPSSIPAIGCRSRIGLPAPVQCGSW
jgi:hypothetical protein